MNDKIRELIDQAQTEDIDVDFYTGMPTINVELDPEKLVELVVKECMNICKTGGVSNSDYNTGRLHCVSDIKHYFNVE